MTSLNLYLGFDSSLSCSLKPSAVPINTPSSPPSFDLSITPSSFKHLELSLQSNVVPSSTPSLEPSLSPNTLLSFDPNPSGSKSLIPSCVPCPFQFEVRCPGPPSTKHQCCLHHHYLSSCCNWPEQGRSFRFGLSEVIQFCYLDCLYPTINEDIFYCPSIYENHCVIFLCVSNRSTVDLYSLFVV